MGKKSTKVLSGALATTSLLGGVMGAVPAFAATNLDAIYKSAYDAVIKAQEDESQESITAARKAIDELRKHKELQGFVGEFSKQADKVQQKLFDDFYSLLFVDGKKKDKIPQKDINKAREFVKSFDSFEGNKQYTASWSTAVDGFQQVLVVEAHDAVVKAMTSKDEKDVKAAEELVKVLATSTNEDTKKEAERFAAITVELQKEIQEEAAKLKVASVSAINAMEQSADLANLPVNATINVTFNTELDKTAVNVNNFRVYEVKDNVPVAVAASEIKLSQDGKTVSVDLSKSSLNKAVAHKLEIKNVKSKDGKDVQSYVANFTTSKMAVVTAKNKKNLEAGNNPFITYDELLDASTINTQNISLVSVETGEKLPIKVALDNKKIDIIPDASAKFYDKKEYKLVVNNVLTSTGEKAESYSYNFVKNGESINLQNMRATTLDGCSVWVDKGQVPNLWPKVESGVREYGNKYFAGLNIQLPFNTKLNESTIAKNIQLIEKESKAVVPVTFTYNDDAKRVSMVPKADLKEDTDYVIQFKGGLATNYNIKLKSDKENEVIDAYSIPFKTMDVTAPTVVSAVSKNGDSNLKITEEQVFTVTLSENVKDLNNILLVKAKADLNNIDQIKPEDKVTVEVQPVADKKGVYEVKVAKNTLAQNEAYKLVIVGKDKVENPLTDGSGNTLKRTFVTAFTTEGKDVTAPKVTKMFKGDSLKDANAITSLTNVKKGDKLTVLFDEKLLELDPDAKVKVEKYDATTGIWSDGVDADKILKANTDGDNVAVTVTMPELNDGKYRLAVVGVKDAASNKMTDTYYFEFVGSSNNETVKSAKVGKDNSFKDLPSEDIKVDSIIEIAFNDDTVENVKAENVKVTDAAGKVVEGKVEAKENAKGVFYFKPAAELAKSTVYTVTVDGVKDKVGNTIDKFVTSFKTIAGQPSLVSASVKEGETNVDRLKTKTVVFDAKVDDETKYGTVVKIGNHKLQTADGKTYSLEGVNLDPLTKYAVTIKVTDKASGKDIVDESYDFFTGSTSTDDIAPEFSENVNGKEAKDGFYEVVKGTKEIGMKFSEVVNAAGATVTIKNVTDDKDVAVLTVTSKEAGKNTDTVKITPVLALEEGKTYKVIVKGVKDAAGNVADDTTIYVKLVDAQ